MEFKLNIDGVSKGVHVERVEGGFVVTVDGREYAVADVVAQGERIYFSIGQRIFAGLVSHGQDVGFSMRGRYYRIAQEPVDADRPVSSRVSHGRLEAPMPGNIVSVNVDVGDTVSAGTPVVVLESMKMQNEITAPFDGTVERISCAPGDQVGFGQVLAEIVPAKG